MDNPSDRLSEHYRKATPGKPRRFQEARFPMTLNVKVDTVFIQDVMDVELARKVGRDSFRIVKDSDPAAFVYHGKPILNISTNHAAISTVIQVAKANGAEPVNQHTEDLFRRFGESVAGKATAPRREDNEHPPEALKEARANTFDGLLNAVMGDVDTTLGSITNLIDVLENALGYGGPEVTDRQEQQMEAAKEKLWGLKRDILEANRKGHAMWNEVKALDRFLKVESSQDPVEKDGKTLEEAGRPSALDYIFKPGDFKDAIKNVRPATRNHFKEIWYKLKEKLEIDEGTRMALQRLVLLKSRQRDWSEDLIGNNLYKMANDLGMLRGFGEAKDGKKPLQESSDSAMDFIVSTMDRDMADIIVKMDEQTQDLLYEVMTTLAKRLEITRGEREAIQRLWGIKHDGKSWDQGLLRNNVFKAAHALGLKLPSYSF